MMSWLLSMSIIISNMCDLFCPVVLMEVDEEYTISKLASSLLSSLASRSTIGHCSRQPPSTWAFDFNLPWSGLLRLNPPLALYACVLCRFDRDLLFPLTNTLPFLQALSLLVLSFFIKETLFLLFSSVASLLVTLDIMANSILKMMSRSIYILIYILFTGNYYYIFFIYIN